MCDTGSGWADAAVMAVGPSTVVPSLDVFHDGGPGREVVRERLLVKHLRLQMGEERFGHGIIPTHADGAHRLGNVIRCAPVLELGRGVLTGFNQWKQHRSTRAGRGRG